MDFFKSWSEQASSAALAGRKGNRGEGGARCHAARDEECLGATLPQGTRQQAEHVTHFDEHLPRVSAEYGSDQL
jgi:hypothetical protein